MRLVRPSMLYESQILAFRKEMMEAGDSFDGCAGLELTESVSQWLNFEERLKQLYGDGYVPSDVFLYVDDQNQLIGIIDYRHPLTPFLLQYGGSIGYSIRPSCRRQGHAVNMLKQMLEYCKQVKEGKVLLCCDRDNIGSYKTIQACGGRMENMVQDDVGLSKSGWIRRYWIIL